MKDTPRTASGKILLHADAELSRELAEEINEVVGKIGPIQIAGMALAKQMEHTTGALKEGLEKIDQANKELIEAVPGSIIETIESESAPDPKMAEELEQLRRENTELKEKLKKYESEN